MPSIQSSGWPLAFEVGAAGGAGLPAGSAPSPDAGVGLRTVVRALEGMQKEAVVSMEPEGTVWRLVSDEGPYLNGTDLAPFPLAFFAAGMQFSFLSQLLQAAGRRRIDLGEVTVELDNRYTMEGSFLRGDALGGAIPSELAVSVESSASAQEVASLIEEAAVRCGAQSVMSEVLRNTFSLSVNDTAVPVTELAAVPTTGLSYESSRFDALEPVVAPQVPIIEKLESAETVHGVEGGAGSSLKSEQKRTLHVHGRTRRVQEMDMECTIDLIKPIGSTFRFRSDETRSNGGGGAAPPPLAYLTAGVGFCFMTQIGRYAHILKQPLEGYSIVQDNVFAPAGDGAGVVALPTETHTYIDGADGDTGVDLLNVGERTCFLHAAMRNELPSVVTVSLNGAPLPLS